VALAVGPVVTVWFFAWPWLSARLGTSSLGEDAHMPMTMKLSFYKLLDGPVTRPIAIMSML
jgi:hypothetical protein